MKRTPTPALANLENAVAQIRVALEKSVAKEPHGMSAAAAEKFRAALHKATEQLEAARILIPVKVGPGPTPFSLEGPP